MGTRAERVYKNPTWLLKYGAEHPMYVENPSYNAIHSYIKRRLPKLESCQRCGKTNCIIDLANLSQQYKRDISDWQWLCRSCHRKHDWAAKSGNKCKNGHPYTAESTYVNAGKRACRICRHDATRRMRARVKALRADDPIKYLGENT